MTRCALHGPTGTVLPVVTNSNPRLRCAHTSYDTTARTVRTRGTREVNLGNRTKPELPKWAVSRRVRRLRGCSFRFAAFSAPQPGPFRRNGTDRFAPRVRVAGCVRSHESRVQVKFPFISWATERSPDRWDRGAADLPRDGADDGGLDRGGAGAVASSARTWPVWACARQENGQERDHRLYCLCCGSLAQACHATSHTA